MKKHRAERLIENDAFPFELLSQLAERESWRKEVHRPIYHVHKWWAQRLGSVFRGILLGCMLTPDEDLTEAFYLPHDFSEVSVFDPFMGSGTTLGEAHKLGFTALGRDINPVAVRAVEVALGPMDARKLEDAFCDLSENVGTKIRALYHSTDSQHLPCDVLYYFWVMQVGCPGCHQLVDLFPSWVIARNADPTRKPRTQILCPSCGSIFQGVHRQEKADCPTCGCSFRPGDGPAKGAKATCTSCGKNFTILAAVGQKRPSFRLYAKLVLTQAGEKEYVQATAQDLSDYRQCSVRLQQEVEQGRLQLPHMPLSDGCNTRQAMNYGFNCWRDFFNDRQLLALSRLRAAIAEVADPPTRAALFTLFSGTLEFNNMFASYKGEGTGAVRHMFAHHILKPERTPIEANVWGTPKSSGSFSGLFRTRLLRALQYRLNPTEINGAVGKGLVCAAPFSGMLENAWPVHAALSRRGLYLSCGDSAETGLPNASIDLVVTDPPFFDNVHYSELADFFYAWQRLSEKDGAPVTTRNVAEVQDAASDQFAAKLLAVLRECHRILKDDGLLVFTYHHSRKEGWSALAQAVLGAGFVVVNSQPVKGEMSVAAPKAQAKAPIQLDIILACRKKTLSLQARAKPDALTSARAKVARLRAAGFKLSVNDQKIVLYGQLLTTLNSAPDGDSLDQLLDTTLFESSVCCTSNPRGPGNSELSSTPVLSQGRTFEYAPLFDERG